MIVRMSGSLLTLKRRLPFFEEGGAAFLEVVGGEEDALELAFPCKLLHERHRPAHGHGFRVADGERAHGCELCCDFLCASERLAGGGQLINHAVGQGI